MSRLLVFLLVGSAYAQKKGYALCFANEDVDSIREEGNVGTPNPPDVCQDYPDAMVMPLLGGLKCGQLACDGSQFGVTAGKLNKKLREAAAATIQAACPKKCGACGNFCSDKEDMLRKFSQQINPAVKPSCKAYLEEETLGGTAEGDAEADPNPYVYDYEYQYDPEGPTKMGDVVQFPCHDGTMGLPKPKACKSPARTARFPERNRCEVLYWLACAGTFQACASFSAGNKARFMVGTEAYLDAINNHNFNTDDAGLNVATALGVPTFDIRVSKEESVVSIAAKFATKAAAKEAATILKREFATRDKAKAFLSTKHLVLKVDVDGQSVFAPPREAGCKDTGSKGLCTRRKQDCAKSNPVRKACKMTCGLCLKPTPMPTPGCADKNSKAFCTKHKNRCSKKSSKIRTTKCQKTCGTCGAAPKPVCKDKSSKAFCAKNKKRCKRVSRVKNLCQKTCKRC